MTAVRLRSVLGVLVVLLAGAIGAWLVLRGDGPSAREKTGATARGDSSAGETPKGPHGGRLLSDGSFQLEVTIYERGVPPHFRVYAFEAGRPLDPRLVGLRIELHRLGGRVDNIGFRPQADYLLGDKTVDEPHSFDVGVAAERDGRMHRWEYSDVEGRVEMPPEALASSGIVVATAGPVRIKRVLEVPGEVALNADRVAQVTPRLGGVLTEVRPSVGATVKQGEVLAVVESRELADVKREFIEATQRVAFARVAYEREEMLWKKKISAEEEYLTRRQAFEEARIVQQSARQKLMILGVPVAHIERLATDESVRGGGYPVRAPFDGTVIQRRAAPGEAVKGEEVVFVVADLRTVWVDVAIPVRDLPHVRVGQPATVRADAVGLEATGTLAYLGALIGQEPRVARGRVVVDNRDGRWRPGLFVGVKVVQEEAVVPVAVKTSSIQTWRDSEVVFGQFGRFFEVRPLRVGRSDGEWIEVVTGLAPGQKYVVENSFVLKAELEKAGATHDH